MRDGRGHLMQTIYRCAFVRPEELLGGISAPSRPCAQAGSESYRFFVSDPRHPSLGFKRVSQRSPVYSVRVSIDYRALGVMDDGDIVWFWIGAHHEYDRLLAQR